MNDFITWENLQSFGTLVSITFMVVEFIKNLPLINKVRTKYLSSIISFVLIVMVNLHSETYNNLDLILYFLSSLCVSFSSNGLSDFNNRVIKTQRDIKFKK